MPRTGHFILHSSVMPPITAGRYELRTEQTGTPFSVAAQTTHVQVAAPRYTMPTDQILSSFPPANAEGAFGDRLPQIVLKRRTLPWERNPAGVVAPSPTPWLALVVVAEGEAELSTATAVADCVTPGTTLLEPEDKDVEQGLYLAVTETVVRKTFPTQEDLPLLTHVREVDVNDTELANGDDDGWLAVVLANRLPVFDKAAGKPVRYMACLVNLEGQLAALPPPELAVEFFEFALVQDWSVLAEGLTTGGADPLVMGGQRPGKVILPGSVQPHRVASNAAHVAGLAGQVASGASVAGALDGSRAVLGKGVVGEWSQATKKVAAAARDPDAQRSVRDVMGVGFRWPISVYAAEKVLRFPVLAHWSFTTNEGATFETLMRDLDVGLLGTLPPPPPPARAGSAPPAPAPAETAEVVATGHLGLDHRTRRGDAVRAWYRGPCAPFPTARDGAGGGGSLPLAHSADQLRRIIPDGREDLTLAAAFEIGRLLALSQLSVVSALLRLRGEQFGAGRVREIIDRIVPFDLPPLVANAGVKQVDLGRFVAVQMIEAMATNAQIMLGPQRPLADPGRAVRISGDLDALVANGLGLDLGVLKKRSAEIGTLAALQMTAVPLAGQLGNLPLDKAGVAALQGALQDELARTLGVAAPPVLRSPAKGQRAAEAPPDALDQLIAMASALADDDEGAQDEEEPGS